MGNITQKLREEGFVPVLGSLETIGMQRQSRVEKGSSLSWDYNNGVYVVYDDAGDPWVVLGRLMRSEALDRINRTVYDETGGNLRKGAYVPHSNDGGVWIRARFGQS